jgi:uncharacterized membrane protein
MDLILIIILAVCVFILFDRVSGLEKAIKAIKSGSFISTSVPLPPATGIAPVPQATRVAVPSVAPVAKKKDSEFIMGTRWFTGAGVIAVLLGVGFFFRYAFSHNLISAPLRVVIGILFGAMFIGLGWWLKRKYRNYGLSLIGVGLGAIYLSFYAAYAFYSLIPALLSFALVLLVVALGIVLAVVYDTKELVSTSLAAGYLGVVLFLANLSFMGVFATLLLMSLVLISVSYYKRWPEVVSIGLLFTTVCVVFWIPTEQEPAAFVAELLSVLYAVFALATLINFAKTESEYSPWQTTNLYLTPIIFFVVAYTLLHDKTSVALISLGIAVFYGILTLIVRSMAPAHVALKKFIEVSRLIMPAFLALAILTYFDGNVRVLGLAAEGVIVVMSGLLFNNRYQYLLGQILLVVSMLFSWVFTLGYQGELPLLTNAPTLTSLAVGTAFLAAWIGHSFFTSSVDKEMQVFLRAADSLLAYLTYAVVIWIEISRNASSQDAFQYYLLGASLLGALMYGLGIVFQEKATRYATYVLFFVSVIGLIVATFVTSRTVNPLVNSHVGAMIAVAALGSLMYVLLRLRNANPVFASELAAVRKLLLAGVNLVVICVLTMSIHWYYGLQDAVQGGGYLERLSISLFWLIYASAGLVIGIIRRSVFSRQVAAILFVLTTLKILLFDSLELTDFYRFVSFIALGLILLIAGYLYSRFKDRINSFVGIAPTHI